MIEPICTQCGKEGPLAPKRDIFIECRINDQRKVAAKNYKPTRKSPVLDDSIAAVLSRKW